ncbi:nuclear receptor-interacting protein 2 [Thomomys bottae]
MSAWQEATGGDRGPGPRGQMAALGDPAPLSQQRRLKQATQFLHKDSADLLPLDTLRRLGTSKTLQPHSVLQRRLVEGHHGRLQGATPPVLAGTESQGQEGSRKPGGTEGPALCVSCKCQGQRLSVAVNTSIQYNQISAAGLQRLGLPQTPSGELTSASSTPVQRLQLELGPEPLVCEARVVETSRPEDCADVESPELSLGLRTLRSLKCCIDLERGVLRLGALSMELPFSPVDHEPGQRLEGAQEDRQGAAVCPHPAPSPPQLSPTSPSLP